MLSSGRRGGGPDHPRTAVKGKRASILVDSTATGATATGNGNRSREPLATAGEQSGHDDDDDDDDAIKAEDGGRVKTYAQAVAATDSHSATSNSDESEASPTHTAADNGSTAAAPAAPAVADSNGHGLQRKKNPAARGGGRRVIQSFPNTPIPSVYSSTGTDHDHNNQDDEDESESTSSSSYDDDEDDSDEWGPRRGFGRRPTWSARVRRVAVRAGRRLKRVARAVGDFMTVPLWAAVLSLLVACIPPVQHTLNKAEALKACVHFSSLLSLPPSCPRGLSLYLESRC